MNSNLQRDSEYNIELGDSFSSPSSSEFHSLVYKFKPKSLKDNSWEGKIDIDPSSTVVHLTASSRLFKGTYEAYKKPSIHECILIYDKNSNTFTLEKLHATIGALQQIENSSSNNLQGMNSSSMGGGGGIMTMGSAINGIIAESIVPSSSLSTMAIGSSALLAGSVGSVGNVGSNVNVGNALMRSSSSTQLLGSNKTTPPKRGLVTPSNSTHSLDLESAKKKLKESPPNSYTMIPPINNIGTSSSSIGNSIGTGGNGNSSGTVIMMDIQKPTGMRTTSEIDSKNALDSDSSGSDADTDSSDSDSTDNSDSDSSDSSDSDSS